VIIATTLLGLPTSKVHRNLLTYDVEGLHNIKNIVPIGDTILVPPSAGEVRFLAERSIVVDFSASPLDLNMMSFWSERILRLGCGFKNVNGLEGYALWDALSLEYNRCSVNYLVQIARDYGAKFLILEEEHQPIAPGELIFEGKFGKYQLFKIL
jgi:hypothetical protein